MARRVKIQSGIPMRGDMRVVARDAKTGRVIRRIEIRNTITFICTTALVKLLAQRAADPLPSTFKLTELRVGTGTTPPVRGDTALVTAVPSIDGGYVTINDVDKLLTTLDPLFELRNTVTLQAGAANGYTLTEAGLFAADGTMFARQIHPAIPKTAALVIDYDWRIAFSA